MTEQESLIWLNGKIVPSAAATVHVFCHGMQRGSTVFDVVKVVQLDAGPAAFGLREHVARFCRSMDLMGMQSPYEVGELEVAVAESVAANPGAVVVKLAAAWTEVPLRSLPLSTVPQVYVAAFPPNTLVDAAATSQTVKVKLASAPKIPASVLPPSLKVAASYTPGVREGLIAQAAGFDDVVFRTIDGDLAEGTTLSLFVISNDSIKLPALDSVLDGITRRAVLDVAKYQNVPVEIRTVSWDEVTGATELFLSSTNFAVLPVEQLDQQTFEAPGRLTAALAADVEAMLEGSHELSGRWLTAL